VAFRKYVRNIIDWGKGKRLEQIRESLDNLLEESRKRTSEAAKSRPQSSDDSASSTTHKRRASRKGKTSNVNQVSFLLTAQQPLTSDRPIDDPKTG
jgi:hypothetical protein